MLRKLVWLLILLVIVPAALAQESAAVPDLTGLTLPEAAALLNTNGFLLGSETAEGWTEAAGLPQNSIGGQSVAPGASAPRGSAIDVTVLRSPNTLLLYDDNDLTLVNQGDGTLDLNSVQFQAVDGSGASFNPARWSPTLEAGDCGQVWSVGRGEPKRLPECDAILWLTTNNPAEHFWTGAGGTTQFRVVQNGIERGVCAVSNPGQCQVFLATGGGSADVTEYVYFAYTTDRLIVRNTATGRWMPTGQLVVYNQNFSNGTVPLTLGDPTLFTVHEIMGDVTRLAPGQCLYFTNSSPERESPPQDCFPVARLDIAPDLIFWSQDFALDSVTDGERRTCPAAEAGKLTICVMPR